MFRNDYYHNDDNKVTESRAAIRREQRNYLEENNYNSILRKDSMHERDDYGSRKNPVYHNEVRPLENGRDKAHKKRKGLLIDYIRSKYAD